MSTLEIRRYANRKLYAVAAKQYIALDGIADLLRSGNTVRVVDHVSGEDLTSQTLVQIILEQEKKQISRLSRDFLASIILVGEDALSTAQQALHTWQQPAVAAAVQSELEARLWHWQQHPPADITPAQFTQLAQCLRQPLPTANSYALLQAQIAQLEAQITTLEQHLAKAPV